MTDFADYEPILRAAEQAEAQSRALDPAEVARDVGVGEETVRERIETLERWGLIDGGDETSAAMVLAPGQQFLASRGHVHPDILGFLPLVIDDLLARRALLEAGTVLVHDFREALLAGRGVERAWSFVPDPLKDAVDERVAIDLYAAAVALMARLSSQESAGCYGEEVMAVALIEEAQDWLDGRVTDGRVSLEDADRAAHACEGLFDLFGDGDVRALWELRESTDTAATRDDLREVNIGFPDQGIGAWFEPFGFTAQTGYLAENRLYE